MKVIHLISGGDTGGAKTHIHSLLSGISGQIEILLVCFMRGEFSEEAEALGIPTLVLETGILSAVRRLKKIIKAGGYEVIHSHGSRGNFIASLLKRACKIPLVMTVHSDPKLDYLGRPLAGLVYGSLNDYALHRADYLIGVSDSMRELLSHRGFSPNEIFTIYNGVDFSIDPRVSDKLTYLSGLGLDLAEDSVVVGIAARLDPVKDVACLLRGFAQAEKQFSKLRLVIAGDGSERSRLELLAEELGISQKVCFAGWISGINSFFAAIDINTLTSLSETFPYALTEGARARLATVSSRVGGVPHLIRDGETGFLFSPGDYKALGERLLALARDKELRREMGNALYERARGSFSVEATALRQLQIYGEVLRREERRKKGEKDGLIICGAYGMGNAGDDAILEAIVGEMRGIDAFMPITALSRRPRETREKYGVNSVYMFNVLAFRRVMRGTKLYLSGGGSLIQNVTSRRSLWYYLYTIYTAKKLGNSVMMYGCGIGPIVDERDEAVIRRVLNRSVDVITLRERHSLKELQRLLVLKPRMLVSSDPALTLPPASVDRVRAVFLEHRLDPREGYVCFSVRNWEGFEEKAGELAEAADYVAERLQLQPLFFLMNRDEDGVATEQVRSLMRNEAQVIGGTMDSSLSIGVLSQMRAVVSMRLHGLIFAASQGVPLVGISYDPKVTAFLDSVGADNCLQLGEVTAERLCGMIEVAVRNAGDKEMRKRTIERLLAAEGQNSFWAKKLLDGEGKTHE